MTDPIAITLAGKPYSVTPLNLGQIEDMSVAVVLPDTGDPQENIRRDYRRCLAVVAAALSVDHPEITADALRTMPGITKDELNAAYGAVLVFSGLVKKEDTAGAGEAKPPAAAPAPGESTGSISTGD